MHPELLGGRQGFGLDNPNLLGNSEVLSQWAKMEGVNGEIPHWMTELHDTQSFWLNMGQDLTTIAQTVGEKTDSWKIWLYYLDSKVSGETQIPAYTLTKFAPEHDLLTLARLRVSRFTSGRVEDIGDSVAVYGATSKQFTIGTIGLAVSAGSRIFNAYLENKSGSHLNTLLDELFVGVMHNKRAAEALGVILSQKGLNRNLIEDVGVAGYRMELAHVREIVFRAKAKPAVIGSAMLLGGNMAGMLVAGLGSAAVKIGDFAHRFEMREKKPAGRWAAAAGVRRFSEQLSKLHIKMVMALRIIGEAPNLLNVYILAMSGKLGEGAIGAFMGSSKGLEALSGTLSLQRSRADQTETVESLQELLAFLGSPDSPVLNTHNRKVIRSQDEHRVKEVMTGGDGLYLRKFLPFYGKHPEGGYSAHFRSGTVTRVFGESGLGKTMLLEGIAQLFNHRGEAIVVDQGEHIYLRDASDDALKHVVVSISKENLSAKGDRVFDYFMELVKQAAQLPDHSHNSPHLVALHAALQGLSEDDRALLLNSPFDQLITNAKNSLAPPAVRGALEKFIQAKSALIESLLASYFPKGDVKSESFFSQLSLGMKQRVINGIVKGYITHLDPKLLILDEMVEGLDDANVQILLKDLSKMLSNQTVLWVAHNRNDLVAQHFGDKYLEFDIASGLFEEEKQTAILNYLKNETTNWLLGSREGEEPHWQQFGKGLIILSDLLTRIMPITDYEDVKKTLIEKTADYLDSFDADWRWFVKDMKKSLGFDLSSKLLLQTIAQWGKENIGTHDLINRRNMDQDLALFYWLQLPLSWWFSDAENLELFSENAWKLASEEKFHQFLRDETRIIRQVTSINVALHDAVHEIMEEYFLRDKKVSIRHYIEFLDIAYSSFESKKYGFRDKWWHNAMRPNLGLMFQRDPEFILKLKNIALRHVNHSTVENDASKVKQFFVSLLHNHLTSVNFVRV